MAVPQWAQGIEPEELPDNVRTIAERIGAQATLTLLDTCGGLVLYIPKLDTSLRGVRNRKIIEAYNGYNAKALALEYNTSESWIKRLVIGDNADGQISMFDAASGGP